MFDKSSSLSHSVNPYQGPQCSGENGLQINPQVCPCDRIHTCGFFSGTSYNCRHVGATCRDGRKLVVLVDLRFGDMGAGGLEDDPLTYRHGVVGEPFVVAAQQSDVDRGRDGVRPLRVHQDAEQKSM